MTCPQQFGARSLCGWRRLQPLLLILLATLPAWAQMEDLPDIGGANTGLLSLRMEAQIGRQVYYSLLETGTVMTDPELQEYIQDLGMRLVANAQIRDDQRFTFFMVDNPAINAFALPGGYIGMHTGLLQATANESELAGVVAHEISHVTQRHISRAVFANQRMSTISLASMLGAILVGVATGADPGLIQGAVGAAQGFAMEQQISFTRANEYEADRVGISVLANAGFDPMAMTDFFETMGRKTSSLTNRAPEFLLTHPLSADRMAEARSRARTYPAVDINDSPEYAIARARSKLLTSSRPESALDYFEGKRTDAPRVEQLEVSYGTAITLLQLGRYKQAETILAELLEHYEAVTPLYSALAQARQLQGDTEGALVRYEEALELFPRNVPLTVRYCEALLRAGEAARAHTILLDLLNQVPPTLEQVRLIAIAANASGDVGNAHYYMAEYHAMSGSLRLAIEQLQLALGTPGLDTVQQARLRARLEEFQSYLPTRAEQSSRASQENP